MSELRGLHWDGERLTFLEQTLLPAEEKSIITEDWQVVVEAIKRLAIRGAPAIGVAGAFAGYFAAVSAEGRLGPWNESLEEIATARPTAVNLARAVNRLRVAVGEAEGEELIAIARREAVRIAEEDERLCEGIANAAQPLFDNPKTVLTHCNTGALVTYGIGTALGAIRRAHEREKIDRVYACEARPLGQGSRLTMWELDRLGIPGSLLPDSAAGSLLASGEVDLVIVGADRIAANGDTANKVGTLNLAVLANRYNVSFYIAAPATTFDPETATGGEIPIEMRSPDEVRRCGGNLVTVPGAEVYNPAFDVTPSELITGIIFEGGILVPPYHLERMPY